MGLFKPTFDWIKVVAELGMTIVGMEKVDRYDFEYTSFRFDMVFGLVNNEKGLLVTDMNLWDIRMDDFTNGSPTARCVFNNGRHGLITRNGTIVRKDFAYIGDFNNGLARMSIKGKLSGSLKYNAFGLAELKDYLEDLFSPSSMIDYTIYDENFKVDAQLICEDCEWGYLDTLGNVMVSPKYDFARDCVNGVSIVLKENKWGVVSKDGQQLLECKFDDLQFLKHTDNRILKVISQQQKYGLIDTLGRVTVNLAYDEIGAYSNNRLAVKKNGNWGFVDQDGNEVIACKYQKVKNFHEGRAAVKMNNKWCFIDQDGEICKEACYAKAGNFSNNIAWVVDKTKYNYIDENFKVIIKANFDKAYDFENGIARVVVNGKYALINKKGQYILKPKYDDIAPFNEHNLALVRFGNDKIRYGLINRKGQLITDRNFNKIGSFSEGLAVFKDDHDYGYIDTTGKVVIEATYSKASNFSESRAAVQRNGKCGYINKRGLKITNFEFTKCLDFKDGKAVVYKGYKKAGLLDHKGNVLIEPSINKMIDFSDGRGLVRDDKYRFYYITEDAEAYNEFYQEAGEFQHGVAVVQSKGQWGIINQKGIPIIPPKYDKIGRFQNGYAKVRIKHFNGLSDLTGKMIAGPEYEYISYAGQGLFRVEKGEKLGYFDAEGTWVWNLTE